MSPRNITCKRISIIATVFVITLVIVITQNEDHMRNIQKTFQETIVRFNSYPESDETIAVFNEMNIYGHFDTSGKYKIIPYMKKATKYIELSERPLCVAVQSSLDFAFRIIELVDNWPGAVSYSLFVPAPLSSLAMNYLAYLSLCFPAFDQQVSVHMVFPAGHELPENIIKSPIDCNLDPKRTWEFLVHNIEETTLDELEKILYPQNILRNFARENCQNSWIMSPDIDMVFPLRFPDNNITETLETFLTSEDTQKCDKCAFVLPVYEIHISNYHIPINKSELLEFIKGNTARRYHVTVFKQNQELSQLDKWEKLSLSEIISIAYEVKQFKFWYEPIYIARRGAPKFDERYLGFGMVRNTQAFEMSLAGYIFQVLDNIFLNHWGFQDLKQQSKDRKQQTTKNHQVFCSSHLKELSVKYNKPDLLKLKKMFSC